MSIAIALFFRRILTAMKRLPRWVWIALIVVIIVVTGILWHNNHAAAQIKAADKAGYERSEQEWLERMQKLSDVNKVLAAEQEDNIAIAVQIEREQNVKKLNDITKLADALRLRGPGQASACIRSDPRTIVSDATSGYQSLSGGTDVAVGGLPTEEPLALVPWVKLVSGAETCDANRNEVISWRRWWETQNQMNIDYRASLKEVQ